MTASASSADVAAADEGSEQSRRAVDRARDHLDRHFDTPVTLAQLATIAGLSPHHLQRVFRARVGVSPREYQRARRLAHLKARLHAGDDVGRATADAGFGSSSRVYERARAEMGMTPGAYRAGGRGVRIRHAVAHTSLGAVLVAATERGVCAVTLGDDADALREALTREFPRADHVAADENDGEIAAWCAQIVSHVDGAPLEPVPVDVAGTDFQWEVWRALQQIPRGATRSYRDIAVAIGRPAAARAVAGACAANRVALLIPCHRVVRGEGTMGGYRWGVERKRTLLRRESGV